MKQHIANTPPGAGHAAGNPAPVAVHIRPEWVRLPRTGQKCPHTGLSRSALNQLVLPTNANGFKPPVHSVVLRHRGALRGTRLISFDSLCSYLAALAQSEDAPAA